MIRGSLAFLAGFKLLLIRSELRAILWRMIGLLLLIMVLFSASMFWVVEYVASLWIPEGEAWYWQAVGWFAWLLALLLALITAAVSFVMFGSAAVAPWLDELAGRSEAMTGKQVRLVEQSWLSLVTMSLVHSLRPLLELLMWGAVALLFFWLPPVATAIWGYAGIRFLMFELIDTPASRRGWSFAMRKQRFAEQRWFYFGFSVVAALFLIIPLLNLAVIPAAVVGLSLHLCRNDLRGDTL